MAGLAGGLGITLLVAIQANIHGGHARDLRHAIHLGNLTMTGFAVHSRLQMFSVRPVHPGENLINAHPGNRLSGLGKLRQLLNRRLVRGYRGMARHAGGRWWKGHLAPGIRPAVAHLTFESHGHMLFVAVGDGLLGSCRVHGILRDFLIHCLG